MVTSQWPAKLTKALQADKNKALNAIILPSSKPYTYRHNVKRLNIKQTFRHAQQDSEYPDSSSSTKPTEAVKPIKNQHIANQKRRCIGKSDILARSFYLQC